MLRKVTNIGLKAVAAVVLSLTAVTCVPNEEINSIPELSIPEGAPVTLGITFGYSDLIDLQVSTKAEATAADEAHVHDLYVMIFDNATLIDGSPKKIYGRYFAYEHLKESLLALDTNNQEGWWVANKTLKEEGEGSVANTIGAVKISTQECSNALVVVLANVVNAVSSFETDVDNGETYTDDIDYLNNAIIKLDDLMSTRVKLEQDVVNRKDLFLMMGTLGKIGPNDNGHSQLDVKNMLWGTLGAAPAYTPSYNQTYKISLKTLDAKVKFKIRINDPENQITYIQDAKAVYWKVCKTPDQCYLFGEYDNGRSPDQTTYFESENAYFEGKDGEWYTFTFYMLENRKSVRQGRSATQYHQRDQKPKTDTGESGYSYFERSDTEKENPIFENYVENSDEEWIYADNDATYVQFDMVLTLTPEGIAAMGAGNVGNALTSDTIFTVHLGDFSHNGFNDFNTLRGRCYTYLITIANSGSIYAEVEYNEENQPGQEGYLLLTNDEIVNADCHYEYHSVEFTYNPNVSPELFSWYVKTPFCPGGGGGPTKKNHYVYGQDGHTVIATYPEFTARDEKGIPLLDYLWCKFTINPPENGTYTENRVAYPGDSQYDPDWGPWSHLEDPSSYPTEDPPALMDINQLIEYIFDQTEKRNQWNTAWKAWDDGGRSGLEPTDPSAFLPEDPGSPSSPYIIRATIFIDEYYYETHPLSNDYNPDPDLWRDFVNAQPREMHILSDARQSRDRKSDVILSSHSVIQQSIQTMYNIHEPSLRTLWGCEHLDEIKTKVPAGWKYWPDGCSDGSRAGTDDDEGRWNGRLNSAYIWRIYNKGNGQSISRKWSKFLNYRVINSMPELRDDDINDGDGDDGSHHYQGMAWSCLSRNRDNDGDGIIDPEEVRWYLAASQQLAGIWVGNESLSLSARLYQPAEGQWRAHVVSSTNKLVSWAEEGGGATPIENDWRPTNPYYTWADEATAAAGESVRCVRNIGTYNSGGDVVDISRAPYNQVIDEYFTVDSIGTGGAKYFVFNFDRLDKKSIREYSANDLPYHDQNSKNNRVYVQMITQNLNEDVDNAVFNNIQLKDINNRVTQLGNNPYCPPGYRFPNHTEWVLMSLYLPEKWLKKDKNGNDYVNLGSKATVMPSRTYYDRGYYGSLGTNDENVPWHTEYNKVGWIFSNKMHCSEPSLAVTHSRCVKDDDQTGEITGAISVPDNILYPDDLTPVSFNFSSTASAFTSASLKLCYYVPSTGNYREIDVPVEKTPKGLQYRETQHVAIPSLADLRIDEEYLRNNPVDMQFVATLTNVMPDKEFSYILPVTLQHPVVGTFSIEDDVIYPSDNASVDFDFTSKAYGTNLTTASLSLTYTDRNGDPQSIPCSISAPTGKYYNTPQTITIPNYATLNANLGTEIIMTATLSNASGYSKSFKDTVTLANPVMGSISVGGSYVYPAGNEESVTFNFQSKANIVPLSSATLTLEYTPPGGSLQQRSITLNTSPNSKTYTPTQAITIPTIHDLGLTAADLPLSATLHAVVAVADGLSAESNTAVTIKSHYGGTVEILDGFDPTNGFPIRIDASSVTGFPVQNLKLRWKKQGDIAYTEDTISIPVGEQALTSNTITAYWYPSWLNNTSDVVGCVNGVNDATRTYYFTAVVGSSDANGAIDEGLIGLNAAVDEATMEFLKINYNPCPGNNWAWNNKPPNTLPYRWIPQAVSDMYFASGDFIDAYLDVSNCTYDPKNPGTVDGTNDLGMDNLITFGPSTQSENIGGVTTALSWSNGNVLFYYPARNGSNNNLQIAVHGGSNISRVQPFDLPQDRLKIILKRDLVNDKGVVLVNNYSPNDEHEPDWYNEEIRSYTDQQKATLVTSTQGKLNNLTASNRRTVYVGSTEGQHRSRALYKYVRVVRKHN